MKKNIGILFSSSRKMGVFQYGLSIAEALINHCPEFEYTLLYFEQESPEPFLKVQDKSRVRFVSLSAEGNSLLGKAKVVVNCLIGRPLFVINKKNHAILKNHPLDLLVIPFQLLFGFEHRIPYVMSVPDLMYKYYPQFPEYSGANRRLSDFIFTFSTKFATLLVTDSEGGKKDLQQFFHVPAQKIRPIPYLPPGYVFLLKDMTQDEARGLLEKFNLPDRFVFYPAQFWAHKNHLRLVEAIALCKARFNHAVPLVLVGNDKANSQNYQAVMAKAQQLGVQNLVMHLGYVSDEEMVALYKMTEALVFASLGGPTNIPLVEAMHLGTPVVYPNLFAMPEQMGDAGLAFDPFDPQDMAEKISAIWQDAALRQSMREKGLRRAQDFSPERYARAWVSAVKEAFSLLNEGN